MTFPGEARTCGYWAADPTITVATVRTLSQIIAIAANPRRDYIGQALGPDREPLARRGRVTFQPGSRADGSAVSAVLVALEGEDRPFDGRPVFRVPADLRFTHTEDVTGETVDFVAGRLHRTHLQPIGAGLPLEPPLQCVEVPGNATLIPMADDPRPGAAPPTVTGPDPAPDPAPGLSSLGDRVGPGGTGDRGATGGFSSLLAAPDDRDGPDPAPGGFSRLGERLTTRTPDPLAEPAGRPGPVPGIVPETVPAARPAGLAGAGAVCLNGVATRLNGPMPTGQTLMLAGLRRGNDPVALMTYDPQLGLVEAAGTPARLLSAPGTLDPLATVGPLRPGAQAGSPSSLLMVRPVGTANLSLLDADPPPPPVASTTGEAPVVHIFAAPGMLRISGLNQLDPGLNAATGGLAPTLIWYPIRGDGTLAQPVTATSFDQLMIEAMLREATAEDPLYELADVLTRSLDEMRTALETSAVPVDTAIWILRGGQLPTIAPQAIRDFLTRTPQTAPIPRLGGPTDRGARRWLYILSGFFAQEFSEAYVSGPIEVVRPTQAAFEMALSERSIDGPLLANADSLVRQIQGNWAARTGADPAATSARLPADRAPSFADGMERAVLPSAYDDIGLVVPRDAFEALDAGLLAMIAAVPARSVAIPDGLDIDPLALWLLAADDDGLVATTIASSVGRRRAEALILEDAALLDEFERFLLNVVSQLQGAKAAASASSAECAAIYLPLGSSVPLWSGE